MFVQALAQFADTNKQVRDALQDEAWENRPVPYLIELSKDGSFLSVIERMTQVPRGRKTVRVPRMLLVPRSPVNRNSGHHPLLGADDIAYVLGVGAWTKAKDQENSRKHHEAFIKLIADAADATNDPALKACKQFYEQPDQVEKARAALAEANPGVIALSVGGPVVLRPATQARWREHYESKAAEQLGDSPAECLISGKFGPIERTHKKVKGLSNVGGRAETLLMSFDKEAFCSHGWERNQNSPVSPGRALAYVLALNHLLRTEEGHRRDIGGVAFIFWLKNPAEFDFFPLLDKPDKAQLKALLDFDPGADPDQNQFYLAGVTGNGGRVRVLYWITDSLAHIKRNLGEWHEQLRVDGFEYGPVQLWQLLHTLDREGEPPKHRAIALLRRAIEGRKQPLGHEMLTKLLGRLRFPKELSQHNAIAAARWGLLRLCINDIIYVQQKGEKFMTENLDPAQTNPAYVCGRLLAEYEGLQYSAHQSQVNVSVADHYYSLASTFPAVAFPKVEVLGKKHLRKLQRDNRGAAVAIEQRLQELHLLLEKEAGYRFPSMLSLEDQGRFALGYHHQRAHSFAQAKARKESKEEEN